MTNSSACASVASTTAISNFVQAGELRRTPAPFAGADIEFVVVTLDRAHTMGWMMPRS